MWNEQKRKEEEEERPIMWRPRLRPWRCHGEWRDVTMDGTPRIKSGRSAAAARELECV